MLPRNNAAQLQNKRKCKEGDWICVNCANYNYSFRNICTPIFMQATDAESRPKPTTTPPSA